MTAQDDMLHLRPPRQTSHQTSAQHRRSLDAKAVPAVPMIARADVGFKIVHPWMSPSGLPCLL